jgi:subtilisin-like proprotein convertase family protein
LKQKKLVKKIKTVIECNIDFNIWQDNTFYLNTPNKLRLQNILLFDPSKNDTIISEITNQLVTLCSVLNEKPYIQYQGSSEISGKVAEKTYKELENLWN